MSIYQPRTLANSDELRLEGPGQFSCRIDHFLDSGSQGEVYVATVDGQSLALKWYLPESATPRQQELLMQAIQQGPPDASFLWPSGIVRCPKRPGFGYLMPLREQRFTGIDSILAGEAKVTFATILMVGFQLARSFKNLHGSGFCYRDISDKNFFLDVQTGDVSICDNDNVGVNNEDASNIAGTPGYMAPEVINGQRPNAASDLHSLAVVLYHLLVREHPLEGQKTLSNDLFDLETMQNSYGNDAVFAFDPDDPSNRPHQTEHQTALAWWPIYPTLIHRLFERAFSATGGLRIPENRVREVEWCDAMLAARDALFKCQHCESPNFYDKSRKMKCWSCQFAIQPSLGLRFEHGSEVMLEVGREIIPHHLDRARQHVLTPALGRYVQHEGRCGLQNLTNVPWRGKTSAGKEITVPPDKRVALKDGTWLHFGDAAATAFTLS